MEVSIMAGTWLERGIKKSFWSYGNILYLDPDDGDVSICICQNSSVCMLKICAFDYMWIIHQ